MRFETDTEIRGDQLTNEILQATGVDLGAGIDSLLYFIPPNVIVIPDDFLASHDAIQAVINAHVPNSMYFQDDIDEASARGGWQALKDAWLGELDYLDATIPAIDSMDVAQVRQVVKRLCQENRRILKAFALIFRRL